MLEGRALLDPRRSARHLDHVPPPTPRRSRGRRAASQIRSTGASISACCFQVAIAAGDQLPRPRGEPRHADPLVLGSRPRSAAPRRRAGRIFASSRPLHQQCSGPRPGASQLDQRSRACPSLGGGVGVLGAGSRGLGLGRLADRVMQPPGEPLGLLRGRPGLVHRGPRAPAPRPAPRSPRPTGRSRPARSQMSSALASSVSAASGRRCRAAVRQASAAPRRRPRSGRPARPARGRGGAASVASSQLAARARRSTPRIR